MGTTNAGFLWFHMNLSDVKPNKNNHLKPVKNGLIYNLLSSSPSRPT